MQVITTNFKNSAVIIAVPENFYVILSEHE